MLMFTFLPQDNDEVLAWALMHTEHVRIIGAERDMVWTCIYERKEGDTAPVPVAYEWDGTAIVRKKI